MDLLFVNNETKEIFVKYFSADTNKEETPKKYQTHYDNVFGKGKYTFYYGTAPEKRYRRF